MEARVQSPKEQPLAWPSALPEIVLMAMLRILDCNEQAIRVGMQNIRLISAARARRHWNTNEATSSGFISILVIVPN
jgi:hypothetical protein